jgi:peptidoglycan/LPS O-acetylase OafA/YrhL
MWSGMKNQLIRLHEVNGIRGWAAFIVLLLHTFGEMLKFAVPVVREVWFAPFICGDIAVLVFFVLSGDALSSGFFSGDGLKSIDRLVVRRYFRLTFPIFLSCCLTYLIMSAGLDFHKQAIPILDREDWLGRFLHFDPTIFGLFRYSLIDVYVAHTTDNAYNPFLWTMSIEMIGSMLVFLFCYIWDRLKNPQLVCLALLIFSICIGSYYSLFFGGVLLGYLRITGYLNKLLLNKTYQVCCALVVLAIIALLMLPSYLNLRAVPIPIRIVISLLLVFCFYTHNGLKAFFCNRLSRFFGEISFPLYLVHFQVLISLMSWMVVQDYSNSGGIDQTHMLVIGCISMTVSIIAASFFRLVEKRGLKFIDSYVLKVLYQVELN